ncbi:MAG: processive 1,2-diacylglycerol beta-glucosyltransferase, partial [Solirubrobacteraceae bacterium]|nr:processive 1,2-diacylglycerol beta-glucosyltransferase [Solirubrobacteraceae bacterium]
LGGRLLKAVGGPGLLRAIEERAPEVVVSTYPGVTETLGRLRKAGRLAVPVVAVITDLASLPMWAHPGVDLHLITHPESATEVRSIAGPATDVVAVRGFNPSGFDAPPDRDRARAALGIAPGPVILVSGGGWGVGDIEGAATVAREHGQVSVLCGTNDDVLHRMRALQGVRAVGFTDRMPEFMAAADVLVHSTAGLTVLEGLICGCRVISYGWGRGHIRVNNAAFVRHGLARVAGDRSALSRALAAALTEPSAPDRSWFALPYAADVICSRFPALEARG